MKSWVQIQEHAGRLSRLSLKDVAQRDDVAPFVWSAPSLEVDVCKQMIDAPVMAAMRAFAAERELERVIAAMFAGEIVNTSEHRPALHWALRGGGDDIPAVAEMRAAASKARGFAELVRSGGLGFEVQTVLHIGIGGSDLGPRLVWDSLRDYSSAGPRVRFCANVDPEDFAEISQDLDASSTLVVVVSKSFKTPETASNAQLAREWLLKSLSEEEVNLRLAAVTSAPDLARQWGAADDRIFPMDEAVGGRYSVWSNVGLSLQICLGWRVWSDFLSGATAMDQHFRDTPIAENTPARLAMMDVFLHTACETPSRTVLAYAHRLRKLPDFLQQLEMESNGKSTPAQPGGLVGDTGPIVWGSVGTLGQHSFHQLLHQGVRESAIEFVVSMDAGRGDIARGRALIANAFAQSEALLAGRSAAEAEAQMLKQGVDVTTARERAPHMHMEGGRGSTMIVLDELSPFSLGALLAMYEHRTFAAGVLWGINPFDQWGVERGKVLAVELDEAIAGGDTGSRDPSTLRLIERARRTLD